MSDEDRNWALKVLGDLLHGRPSEIPPGPALYFIRDHAELGLPSIRRVALSPDATDQSRAIACHLLAQAGEQPPIEILRVLLVADFCWARFHAALAARGPWASLMLPELENALDDTDVLSDMDHIYRVSDLAALALAKVEPSQSSEVLRQWFSDVRPDLKSSDTTKRDLATFVLAELGDVEALAQLEQIAASPVEFQAQSILERVRAKRLRG